MDSFNFRDIKLQKPNAISKHRRRILRITTLFRFVEVFVFLIIVSRFTTKFSFNLSAEHFRGISSTLISPRFVFVLGNAIVIALFFISRSFSGKIGGTTNDYHEDYVEKCRKNQNLCIKEVMNSNSDGRIKMCRSYSENLGRGSEDRRQLRRSMTERCRRSAAGLSGGRCSYEEDEMSCEEFRRTVEAFIERQQRILREDEFVTAPWCASSVN